jgi:uncharacterized protein YjiS (DUF1127 family)
VISTISPVNNIGERSMQFDRQLLDDAILADACHAHRRDAGIFDLFRGRPRPSGDSCPSDGDNAAAQASPEDPTPASHRGSARQASDPRTWRRASAAAMSWTMAQIIEGFARSAAAVHPEFICLPSEHVSRGNPAEDPPCGRHAGDRRLSPPFRQRGGPIAWATSLLAKLWSRVLRAREIRRMRAGWETFDDRMLNDIGVSRCEIDLIMRHGRHRE